MSRFSPRLLRCRFRRKPRRQWWSIALANGQNGGGGDEIGYDYRYRWGWIPGDRKYASQVDAIYEVRNRRRQDMLAVVRVRNCERNTLGGSRDLHVPAGTTQTVVFLTSNCGSAANPKFWDGGVGTPKTL